MDWSLVIVALSTLIGSLGSSFLVGHFNMRSQTKTLELELRKTDEDRKYQEKQELIAVYNNVLRRNGEVSITNLRDNGLGTFDIKLYNEEIRAMLFQHYSKLDIEVATILTKIDRKRFEIAMDFNGPFEYELMLDECSGLYDNLISKINEILDDRRDRTRL